MNWKTGHLLMIIYHNPRCSKSRQTLALIQERGLEPTVIRYLDTPPTKETLFDLLSKLNASPRDIIRKGEDAYAAMGLENSELSDDQLIDAIVQAPNLLERPIVVKDHQAIIGRPPENVFELLP